MNSEILKKIKQKIQDRVEHKELYSVFTNSEEIKLISDCISSIKNGEGSQKELDLLKDIYAGLDSIFRNISADWDSNRGGLSSEKIYIHYQNLGSILEIVTLIKGLKTGLNRAYVIFDLDEPALIRDVESLQKKMKEALEKMQEELEKKAKEEFGKYIENSTIDEVLIKKYNALDLFYAQIKLKDDNKSTDIKISEFLNNDFCKKNNIANFLILNGNQEKIVYGFVKEEVRHYDLGATVQYGIKFNWYVDGKEFSITLGANSDGSIRVIGDRPTDKDLEKNKDVKIKVPGLDYLSLADAVKTCKQEKNEASSKLSQSSTTEYFRPLVRTSV
ncbi:hypothetical protein [Wolbachia endosymbiont of Tribolium confusum]|uniref:hypothetical protein n=1 Tax=Wolbachia endosymbiont of Tribolium confusum TaxID=214474 RepID=UPI001CF1AF4D|nr:hypothetical protein [Wolbachia endosymbiont of Tribolium confusum]MCA7009792.1 hypothetical protein [Wolbachia endosymbiont of Tribolium confusum]